MFRIFLDLEDFVGIGRLTIITIGIHIYLKRTLRTKIQMVDSRIEERQSGQSEEVIIDCVALFYEEGKGGENYRKKNKFRCRISKEAKQIIKLKETVW
jgi:hypothetical protein